jgi:hypothetical protein
MSFHSNLLLRHGVAVAVLCTFSASHTAAQANGFLRLAVLDGEGAFNDIKHGIAHAPVIRVVDESNNLVEGAQVTFTLPMVGASGVFARGDRTATATTDEEGVARCPSFKPNQEEGRFNIRVAAAYRGKAGNLVVGQSNTLAGVVTVGQGKKSNKGMWILLGALGAGAAVGIGVGLGGHSSSSSAVVVAPTTLSAAGITVGGPR